MNPTSLTIKSIYNAYQQNNTDNFDSSFDDFAKLLTTNTKSIGEFLIIFTPNAESNNQTFIKFMDEFSLRLLNTNPTLGVTVLKKLLTTVQKLTESKKISLTRFIWERKSFRLMIKHYPRSNTGKLYMTESIFSNMFPKDGLLVPDLAKVLDAFTPLFTNNDATHDLMQYIDDIFIKNIGYTYEDPSMMNQSIMSTTDMCILCFVIMTKTLQSNYKDPNTIPEYMLRIFWEGINVVYITTHVMDRSITDSLKGCYEYLTKLQQNKNPSSNEKTEIDYYVRTIKNGDAMINNLNKYASNIDTQYVESLIFDNPQFTDYIIANKKYDLIQRLINDIGQTSTNILIKRSEMSKQTVCDRLSKFVFIVLENQSLPVHIKFNGIRLMLSHNLKNNILAIPECENVLCKYILDDVVRLKELEHVHLTDLMIELSDTKIIKNPDIIELYMYLLSEFSDHYIQILKILLQEHDDYKPQIMMDLKTIESSLSIIIPNMTLIGKNCLSYIEDMLSFVETIATQPFANNFADNPIIKTLFMNCKANFIAHIKPSIAKMFNDLQNICEIIITDTSHKKLCNLFGADYVNVFNDYLLQSIDPTNKVNKINIKVTNLQVPNELLDVIKCDVVLNPYYVSTGKTNDQYHLIDRKTYYDIIRTKTNPFTREKINKDCLDNLNEQENIKLMRDNISSKLLELVKLHVNQ